MKNTILLLATSLLLISSTFVFGQDKIYLQNSSNHNHVDLFSAEILSLVNLKVKEYNLFKINDNLVPVTGSLNEITSSNLNIPMINTTVFNNIFSSKTNRSFKFTIPLKFSTNFSWNTQDLFFNTNICQNSPKENCRSIMHSDNTTNRIELDDKGWNSNERMQYQAKDFNIKNWNFNIGPIRE